MAIRLDRAECGFNGILPVPPAWGIAKNPIQPKSGIFMHVCGVPSNYENGLFSGLIGYGITTGHAFDLWDRPGEFEFSKSTEGALMDLPRPFYVLPVDWRQKRPALMPVEPKVPVFEESGLQEISTPEANSHKDSPGFPCRVGRTRGCASEPVDVLDGTGPFARSTRVLRHRHLGSGNQ